MNEDDIPEDEEDGISDRTLVQENEEENPSPEYRMTTITPSVNTIPIADENHDDEEATLADPTLITLQTPLPEQQQIIKQQNINRLMEKIQQQRKAAFNRTNQQVNFVTPTIKTPKKLVVSPGYIESNTSDDSSLTQQDIHEEQSSANTTTDHMEERRAKLEFVFLILLKFKIFFFFFKDLENKNLKNKSVCYLKEQIFFHKILPIQWFHHHQIFQLKVYLKIFVQQVIQQVYHRHLHLFMLLNNKKMIMNNLLKLFKLLLRQMNHNFIHHHHHHLLLILKMMKDHMEQYYLMKILKEKCYMINMKVIHRMIEIIR
jgi:hypothetical protein